LGGVKRRGKERENMVLIKRIQNVLKERIEKMLK
jgi:hypothetical protein